VSLLICGNSVARNGSSAIGKPSALLLSDRELPRNPVFSVFICLAVQGSGIFVETMPLTIRIIGFGLRAVILWAYHVDRDGAFLPFEYRDPITTPLNSTFKALYGNSHLR